jgi:hypothetical protein
MPPRRTRRGGNYDPEDIDDVRKKRNGVKLEMYKLESEGESLTKAEREHHAVLTKQLEKLTTDLRRLKKKKHGKGRTTRRR